MTIGVMCSCVDSECQFKGVNNPTLVIGNNKMATNYYITVEKD
jgi:hypothetical protein